MSAQYIQAIKTTLLSRTALAGSKSLIAYVTFFILFFLKEFDDLFTLPIAGTSAVLLCIAGFPGKSVGACVQGLISALMGVAVGAFNFFLLAKVAHSPAAQACLFFVMVYLLGLLKASDPKWFAFSLLCILMSWNGISTTVNSRTHSFSSGSLISYFTAYLWGGAIVLVINMLFFPHSAEQELRMTLVASLDHCRTFVWLLSKTYRLQIDEEEIRVRDELAQSIRADFSILQGKMAETSVEIIWSKWSMSDYHSMVQKTRAMQQILTTVHTNLKSRENLNVKDFQQDFLRGMDHELEELNRSIYCAFTELQKELAVGAQWDSHNQREAERLKEVDLEQNMDHGPNLARSSSHISSIIEAEARLRSIQQNLDNELSRPQQDSYSIETLAPQASVPDPIPEIRSSIIPAQLASRFQRGSPAGVKEAVLDPSLKDKLRDSYSSFEKAQYQKIGEFLASDRLSYPDNSMTFNVPLTAPSRARSPFSVDTKENALNHEVACAPISSLLCDTPLSPNSYTEPNRLSMPHSSLQGAKLLSTSQTLTLSQTEENEIHQALMRAFSYSFSMHSFLNQTLELLEHVTGKLPNGSIRKKSLHFHFFESFKSTRKTAKKKISVPASKETSTNESSSEGHQSDDEKVELSMRQALDSLEGRPHVPRKTSVLEWLVRIENYLRGPDSICAFKAACAVIVLGILFWADDTRHFATDFSLTGGLITIVVAITPTLGQSWLSFVFQIFGQGLGLIYTMVVLSVFKDVGGYRYNPYGLVVFLALFAAPLCYLLYSRPQLFILCLLALNSAGVLAYTEFLNRNRDFDSAPYRMGKSLTTLAIAMAIVTSFQLLILRNPAKRTLRKATAQVMKANTAYTIILQAYVKATISTDPARHPSPHALRKVYQDLIKRESIIQSQIVGLMPLMKFAGAEPSFVKPFNAAQYLRLIRANQLILDRNRDARMAIGNEPLPEFLMKEFVEKLAHHRERALPHLRVSFYLCTSTLQSKFPLPERLPLARDYTTALFHDALSLSINLAKSPGGLGFLNSRDLTRYWTYLLSMTSISDQLEEIEQAAQILFGKMEDPWNY